MYGELEVNDHHLIKYALLCDFFQYFSSITVYGLPLAQCLVSQFLVNIQSFVDSHLNDELYVQSLRRKYPFQTMGDINKKLLTFEQIPSERMIKREKSILLCDSYYAFAVDQLKEYEVTLYRVRRQEREEALPRGFTYVQFRDELLQINQQVRAQQASLKVRVELVCKRVKTHPYLGTNNFKRWIVQALPKITKWVYMLDQLLLKVRPSIIIDPVEASIYGSILGLLSKKYTIPFVNMPVVAIGDRSLIPTRASHYFVWGKAQKKWLIEREISANKIIETGNIRFYYRDLPTTLKPYMYRKIGVSSAHYVIGFTTQPFVNTNHIVERWIAAIPSHLPITIVLKKHPNDTYEYSLLKNKEQVKILGNEIDILELLYHIDALMTISSTTGFEAALFGKPLFILQPPIPYHYVLNSNESNSFFANVNAGAVISNRQQFIQELEKVISDETYVEELKQKSSKLITETIHNLEQAPLLVKSNIEHILKRGL
ncbi:CDP-glycerol glycerophosphotransferase family protein [Metabacillus iocasae]|uniref:Capsule polysaccharide biosynthesis protein n=1 Tax=Priestia iocasae TaxID=2291674 RepID=A0ABS2QU54_9BACI|nr:CDP-glycerol glycerophosphotransferase family protein [Metabacillus iocasae]MBM7703014.1 hypothetical protein [Metabacillus iocasae]